MMKTKTFNRSVKQKFFFVPNQLISKHDFSNTRHYNCKKKNTFKKIKQILNIIQSFLGRFICGC
jgi:hypothetical protein